MNWNGQRRWLKHAIDIRHEPARLAELQQTVNADRLRRVADAMKTRPVFLPLTFEMTAAAQTSPYRDTTPSLNYDVLITGVKSDNQTRDIIIKDAASETSLVRIGDEQDLFLRVDEFSGTSASVGGGHVGVHYFTTPLLLNAGRRLTVEMFKTDATDDAEEANIVLIGVRVYPRVVTADGGLPVDAEERSLITHAAAIREIPQQRYLKLTFDFDSAIAGGEARNIFTPRVEEPMLIRGMCTSLRHSSIELGLQGEANWTTEPVPCWAIAAEDDIGHERYQWFSEPIYLHSNSVLEIRRVVNGINDTGDLDSETGNTITLICETV